MLAVRSCCIFHANPNKHKQHAISGIRVVQWGQLCGLEKRGRGILTRTLWEAINQTFVVYNSDQVMSLINYVWVVRETSSLSNMGQTGTDFSHVGSHQPALISSLLRFADWNGQWKLNLQQKLNQTLSAHQERAGSWIQVGTTHQDAGRMLFGCYLATRRLPIFRALICKLICGWQRQAWVWERILDVIRCLAPSSFVDWSLIGNESAALPL